MEKKTMGQFISALRKANGFTQKELAEKLNVSDKAVSRWERDECAPDLSLIPVLGEIFGVTCDELLKGEKSSAEKSETESKKSQKQLKHIIDSAYSSFTSKSLVAVGISLIGALLAPAFYSVSFYEIGGCLCCAFGIAALILEIITKNNFLKSIEAEEFDSDEVKALRYKAIRIFSAAISLSLAVILLGILFGCAFSTSSAIVISIVFCLIIKFFVFSPVMIFSAAKKQLISQSAKHRTIKRIKTAVFILICASVIAITGVGHLYFNDSVLFGDFCKGTEFSSFEEFQKYAAKNAPEDTQMKYANASFAVGSTGKKIYYHLYNDEISLVESENGKDITVYTVSETQKAEKTVLAINISFFVLYIIEIAVSVLIFFKKIKKR